jgi:Flp pilus assembly pilin Flp
METINRKREKGLSSLEYALLIALVVTVLTAMAFYLQRSLSGKWRDVGDNFGFGRQYVK